MKAALVVYVYIYEHRVFHVGSKSMISQRWYSSKPIARHGWFTFISQAARLWLPLCRGAELGVTRTWGCDWFRGVVVSRRREWHRCSEQLVYYGCNQKRFAHRLVGLIKIVMKLTSHEVPSEFRTQPKLSRDLRYIVTTLALSGQITHKTFGNKN